MARHLAGALMKEISKMKTKKCPYCQQESDVMYRIQVRKGKEWIFVCPECLPSCQAQPDYRYGGTWKGYRH